MKKTSDYMKARRQKGFTLLFAVLVSSLVLALGLSIANITLKEVTLSGTGRESQFAFYAADTGVECALYWDVKGTNVFATDTTSYDSPPAGPFPCVNEDIVTGNSTTTGARLVVGNVTAVPWNDPSLPGNYDSNNNPIPNSTLTSATTTFQIIFASSSCAIVKVGKYADADGNEHTNIDSRGYNTCDTSSAIRTERGLQVAY